MARLYSFLIGYALGLFQTAFILGKLKGIDIRNYGSGNAGTTNTLRVLGTKAGLTVFAGDLAKALLACIIVRVTFGRMYPEMKYLLVMYAGAGCVLAHDFPFYMKFKGGKGIASTGGTIVGFHWLFFFLGLVEFFVPFLLTHYVSLGSLILYASFLIEMILSGQLGLLGEIPQALLNEMYLITFLLTALAYWQHRANIGRLLAGNERKTYLKKNDPGSLGAEKAAAEGPAAEGSEEAK